ncbi:hypothetical protein H2201_005266 [Coniosporium apollinis]|uniref:F-box domain-containing protein n=1 Tax=Coniosporium apollinis TaxID=61459 RepID=A0ABQ9NSE1_9PEZI|nr:hypothetical protein H2201_005266 [Coniosporium apollinis]
MATIHSIPPELLFQILSYLPIRSLLSFSVTSKSCHALASASVTTLSFGVYPTSLASKISRLHHTAATDIELAEKDDPTTVSLIVPEAEKLPLPALYAFHGALTTSVLLRYSNSLRHLDLTVWTLDQCIATALGGCRSLRSLTLRIENPHVRLGADAAWELSESGVKVMRKVDEDDAWDIFDGAWGRLRELRVEGARVSSEQLRKVLRVNPSVRELSVQRCKKLDKELWRFLGAEWVGRRDLEALSYVGCGVLDMETLEKSLPAFGKLRHLSLLGTVGLDIDEVKRKNDEEWHIKDFVPPQSSSGRAVPDIIEVDPAYICND